MIRTGMRIVLFALAIVASGCATAPQWEHYGTASALESPGKGFTLQAPAGWRRAPVEKGDHVVLTQDGLSIQRLVLVRAPKAEVFPETKAKPGPDLSIRELGELFVAEFRRGNKGGRIELTSLGETRIDGRPAFLARLSERTERGAQYVYLFAGVQGETEMFWSGCIALARHFFEQARPVCERTLASVRLPGL